jgi:hypothetical protein
MISEHSLSSCEYAVGDEITFDRVGVSSPKKGFE